MNCDDAIERLPWLLNGTLAEDERGQVLVHLTSCERCRTALAESRDAWRIFAEHIPAEDLVAHAWGEPTGTDPELLAGHLDTCAQCAAELEMVRTSRQLEEDDRVALFPSRRPAAPPVAPAQVAPAARTTTGSAGKWRAAALAASLAGLVAIGGWFETNNRLQTTQERLASQEGEAAAAPSPAPPSPTSPPSLVRALPPLANVPIVTLSAINVRGGEPNEVPAESPASLLSLGFEQEVPPYDTYAIEFRDASGAVRLSPKEILRLDPASGELTYLLPQGALPPGDYTIVAFGLENGRRTGAPLQFPLTVAAPATP